MDADLRSDRPVFVLVGALSAAILGLLFWMLYLRPPAVGSPGWVVHLPVTNALLNGSSAVCLVAGWLAIRRGDRERHRRWMVSALAVSSVFLASYVTYHHFHGDTKFLAQEPIRRFYFAILITHIFASVVALPMVLTTAYFAASGRFTRHRRLARFTLPIWLYVSVTGVVVFALLRLFG